MLKKYWNVKKPKSRNELYGFKVHKNCCYIAGAETKRDWLIHGHVALHKCNVSPRATSKQLLPAPTGSVYIKKQNGGETRKFVNSDVRAFCLKKYTIGREDMWICSSKFWLFWTCKCLVYAIEFSIYCHDIVKCNCRISVVDFSFLAI